MSSKLSQGELLNNALKEALEREEQRRVRYLHLAKTVKGRRLKYLFGRFASISGERLKQLDNLMKNLNIRGG